MWIIIIYYYYNSHVSIILLQIVNANDIEQDDEIVNKLLVLRVQYMHIVWECYWHKIHV